MKTVKNLSFVLALALGAVASGCASDTPDNGGEGGGGGGDDGSGSDDAPRALDLTGKYKVASTFDIAANAPGKVGAVTNAFIDMTDGAADPAEWIIEQIIAKTTNSTLKSLLTSAKPFVAGYLNDRLLQIAPDFVVSVLQLGQDFGQMARNFGLNETLDVSGNVDAYSGTITALGVHFKVDNIESDILFADHSLANVTASVSVGLDATGKLDIGEHKLPLSYGKVLRIGLDDVLIPAIDPAATNLQTLFARLVNCQAVGQAINDALASQFGGFGGGASTWATACTAGLSYGATALYTKIDAIDSSALEFGLVGTAKAVDKNNDRKVDTLQTGKWTGTLSYSGTPAPLADATFTGARM